MAVTVINKPYDYARAGLFNTAFGILGDQISRMSDRAHEAKKIMDSRNDLGIVAEEMTPRPAQAYQPADNGEGPFTSVIDEVFRPTWDNTEGLGKAHQGDANDLARALSRTKNPLGAFEPVMKLYGGRLVNQDKEDLANRVRSNFLANGGYDRNNESQNMANVSALEAFGLNTGNYLSQVVPNYSFNETNLGNKKVISRQNSLTGNTEEAYSGDVTTSPDEQLKADTNIKTARIAADATRASAGSQSMFEMFQGEDGQIYSYDKRSGRIYQNGQPVQGVKGAPKTLPVKDRLSIAKQILPMVQGASTPEEAWNMLESFSGGDKQTLRLMADIVFGMENVPNDTFDASPNKFYGQYPAQYQQILGGNIVPPPTPAPAQPQGKQGNGYGGYSEDQIQAAQREFGFSREQVIAQINLEMAQQY